MDSSSTRNRKFEFELVTFVIDSRNFGSSAELARGLHRLLLYDGNQRLHHLWRYFLLNNPVSNQK